ncbi:MAG: hypothetical protein KAS32_07355 [Candidatus Peribacteraceae bacterium]|nr:hypothetical protein [Candidatus Peribacteraceae bacterium]
MTKQSELEATLAFHMKVVGIEMESEFRFHPVRRWRFDFADSENMLAVECEGGVYSGGRHVRGKGFENDLEKINAAILLGWRVLRFTKKMIDSGEAINTIEEALKTKA